MDIKIIQKFWDKRPCNIKHSRAKKNSKKYFDEVRQRRYFVEPHIVDFANFKKWKNKKVLDLGCGIGTDTLMFSSQGVKVTAVELSPESLKIAKNSAKAHKQSIKFYQGNIEELSKFLPIQKFDLIYSFGVLHHTPYPERVIKEIKKYCHKDTTIKIMLYYKWSWKAFKLWLRDRSLTNSEAQQKCPLTKAYSKHQARKLLKDFKIKEMKVDFIFPYKIDKYIKYKYEKVWYWPILKCFKKIIGWHLLITTGSP